MDFDALVNEICRRVLERIAACEKEGPASELPKYLVISDDHGTKCHQCLECPVLAEHFRMECALQKDWNFDLNDYEGIVAFGLTNENLGKIGNGVLDTPYTKTFGKAILLGKKIFVPKDEVELYSYRSSAPGGYYGKLAENLALVKKCGVFVGTNEEIQAAMLGKTEKAAPEIPKFSGESKEIVVTPVPVKEAKETVIRKKVITERDVTNAADEGATKLVVDAKSIITDLAKEYAAGHDMVIEKRAGVR